MERQPLNVLILEDMPQDAELMLLELKRAGFVTTWRRVDNEREYLNAIQKGVDVILADYSLPQFNALKALKHLSERGLDIPFIVVTGAVREEEAVACIKAGASDYLLKDRLARLAPAVRQALHEKQLRLEMRRAEAALQDSEARFTRMVSNLRDVIYRYRFEPNPGFEYISPAVGNLIGYTAQELYTNPQLLKKIIHPEDIHAWPFSSPKREATVLRSMRWVHKNGTVIWVENQASCTMDSKGKPFFLEGVIRNVTDRKQAEEEIRKRNMQLAGLSQMGQAVASTLNLDKVLSQLSSAVPFLVGSEGVAVLLREGDHLVFASVSGKGASGLKGMYMPVDQGVAGAVVKNKRSYLVNQDFSEVEMYRKPEKVSGYTTRSLVAVPLLYAGEVVGVLEVVHAKPNMFDEESQRILETAATWAANAIVNARQHTRIQRQLEESQAIGEISEALGSMLDLEAVLQLIVDAARRIIPKVDRAIIHLMDEKKKALVPEAVAGLRRSDYAKTPMRPGQGIAGQVMEQGKPINVRNALSDERFIGVNVGNHLRSLLVAPVQSGGGRLGTISVSSPVVEAFTQEDERLLEVLGVQAALAIERARLFAETRQRVRIQEMLNDITRTVLGSTDLRSILPEMADRFCGILGVDDTYITLWDPEREAPIPVAASHEHFAEFSQLTIKPGEKTLTARVLESGKPVVIQAPEAGQWLPLRVVKKFSFASLLSVPMIVGDQKLGAVQFAYDQPREFFPDEIARAEGIVGQIALAIANTRLLETTRQALLKEQETRRQLVQSEKLAAMGRLIASVAHELNNPLQAIQNALYLLKLEMDLPEQGQEDMDVMLAETERMAGLINRLRQAYRPVANESFVQDDVNILINEVLKLMATHIRHHMVDLDFVPDPGLPVISVMRDQFKQVVLNVTLNAVEAMPDGGILHIYTRNDPDNQGVIVEFKDNGNGVALEHIHNLFDPFFTTKPGGTGLGLWISYDIVQRHRGLINVESKPKKGAIIKVWLPYDGVVSASPTTEEQVA